MGLKSALYGQGEGTLPDDILNGPGQGVAAVVTGSGAVQQLAQIPADAKVPAHIALSVDSGIWFFSVGLQSTDVVSAANAQYRLDATAGPIGVIIDNPRKGFVLGINPATGDIIRVEGSWGV